MFNFKNLAVAISLVGSISIAHANDIVAMGDFNSSPDAETYTFQSGYTPFGIINDWISFTVTAPRDLIASIDPASTIGMSFTEFDLYSADKVFIKSGNFSNSYPVLTYSDFGTDGSVTNFYLKISGPKDTLGNYSGFINLVAPTPIIPDTPVSAVPEPETYAMLLAGLGLMGFIARNRKS